MTLLPPNAFDPPVTKDGRYSPAFLRFLEGLVNAINSGTTGTTTAASLKISGTGWIEVDETATGFVVRQRNGISTTDINEGARRYANHTAEVYNFSADEDVVLQAEHYRAAFLEMTDSGVVLTTGQDVEFPDEFPLLLFKNSTAQTLTLKKNGQTGVTVAAGAKAVIAPGLTDVEKA